MNGWFRVFNFPTFYPQHLVTSTCKIRNEIMGGFYVAHCDVSDADKRLPIVILASWCVCFVNQRLGIFTFMCTPYSQKSTMNMSHNIVFQSETVLLSVYLVYPNLVLNEGF